jgi:hypothetical protein
MNGEGNVRICHCKQHSQILEGGPCLISSVADPDPNPDSPDPHVFGPHGSGSGSISQRVWIRILLSLSKFSKKKLDFYSLRLLFDFLSLKNYVEVPSKSNKQENFFYKNYFFVGILKVNDGNRRIRIRIH